MPPAPRQTVNGFAVASFVTGIAVLCTGIVGGILAVIFGNLALARIDESNGTQRGRGLAIAGIVLGWIAIGLTAIVAGRVAGLRDQQPLVTSRLVRHRRVPRAAPERAATR